MKKKKIISKEDFLNYLNSDKGKNRHTVEREALKDSFMEEAMEGYEDWNREESLRSIKELDLRIKPAHNSWKIAGMAASVLLLLGLTTLWISNLTDNGTQLAVKSEETKNTPSGDINPDSVLSLNEVQNKDLNPVTPSDGFLPSPKGSDGSIPAANKADELAGDEENLARARGECEIKAEEKQAEEEVIAPKGPVSPITPITLDESEKAIAKEKNISKDEISLNANASNDDEDQKVATPLSEESKKERRKESTSVKKAKSRSASTEDMAPSSVNKPSDISSGSSIPTGYASTQKMNQAKDLYAKKEYAKSLILCKEILATDPVQQDALYYSGLNERGLHHPEAAIRHLEKVTKSSVFYYNAKWNLYELSSSDSAKAKQILTELASEPNDFQDKAKTLLGF